MLKDSKGIFFIFLAIAFFSYLVLSPSFSLALFGDDWLAFFRFKQHVEPGSGQWNHLSYYLTPYGSQDILMGILYKIYGFNSTFYYLTSFSLRMLASFSFYPLIYYLTKNKLSAIFASIFFSVTIIGLDTTNWVFNMPTYTTIAFFNLCLYFFLLNREKPLIKLLIISGIFYYLAYITTPIRMHGSLIFLFLLEAFWVIQERNTKTLKNAVIRFAFILVIFLFIRFTGHSQGPPQEASERFNLGIKAMSEMLGNGRFDFLFYPIVMLGSMIIPDFLSPQFPVNSTKSLLPIVVITLLGFSTILFFLTRYINQLKQTFYKRVILAASLWSLFALFIYKGNLVTFSNSSLLFTLLIGGYLAILVIFLLVKFYNEKKLSTLIFLGFAWSITSFIFAWWWVPTSIFPTTYRYLIVSAAGVTILISSFISLNKNRSQQYVVLTLLIFLIFINIWATRLFLNQSLSSHSQKVSNKIWASIPKIPEITSNKKPFIFYFEGDGTNSVIVHDVITFGFPPHMALIYGLTADNPLPVPMSDFKEVISAVNDGKTMPAYGYKAEPVDVENIYAFRLQGKDNLINITDTAREKLNQ